MRFRPLALFALTAGLAVLLGEFGRTDARAGEERQEGQEEVRPAAGPAASRHRNRPRPRRPRSRCRRPSPRRRRRTPPRCAKLIDAEVDQEARRGEGHRVAALLGRRVPPPRLPRHHRRHPDRRQGHGLPRQQGPRQAREADRRAARRPELRPAHGRHLDRQALPARLRQPLRASRTRSTSGSRRSSTRTRLGQDRHRPPHRHRHRGRERGRHLLPRQPLGRQDDRHRRPALPRRAAPVCPVPQPPVHRAGSRPSTGAWPRSSRRCRPTTRRTRTRAATTPRSA